MHTQCNYDANADWRCPETGKQRSPLLIYCSELLLATALKRACSLLGRARSAVWAIPSCGSKITAACYQSNACV